MYDVLKASGLFGALALLLGVGALVCAAAALATRKPKLTWVPLWLGIAAMISGVAGTVVGMIHAHERVAALGGAASPADLAEGISHALGASALGLVVLLVGVVASMVLHLTRRPERRPDEESGEP